MPEQIPLLYMKEHTTIGKTAVVFHSGEEHARGWGAVTPFLWAGEANGQVQICPFQLVAYEDS